MAEYATKKDVEEIVQQAIVADVQRIVGNAVNKTVTKLSEIIANFAQQIDERFNQNEAAVHALDTRLTRVEERLDDLDRKFDRSLATMDRFIYRAT
jgi:replicative DNA helicase